MNWAADAPPTKPLPPPPPLPLPLALPPPPSPSAPPSNISSSPVVATASPASPRGASLDAMVGAATCDTSGEALAVAARALEGAGARTCPQAPACPDAVGVVDALLMVIGSGDADADEGAGDAASPAPLPALPPPTSRPRGEARRGLVDAPCAAGTRSSPAATILAQPTNRNYDDLTDTISNASHERERVRSLNKLAGRVVHPSTSPA